MAPTPSTASTSEVLAAAVNIAKRDRCYYSFGNQYCRSNWYYWGRWVLAGVVLVGLLIFAFCIMYDFLPPFVYWEELSVS